MRPFIRAVTYFPFEVLVNTLSFRVVLLRGARFAMLGVLVFSAGFVLVGRASAQSACAQLGVDCSHPPQPPPIPRYSPEPAADTNSGSSRSSSASVSSPKVNMNAAIKQQVAGSLADAFVQLLFSTDSKAAEQKRQMMEELQRRKEEAERQHKFEEARRLQEMCDRLSATLKLNGLPGLQLKDVSSSAGGLRLKLGDGSNEHVGIQGLPGIALNDDTGNGGNTPYGIPGLPGIYTNGSGGSTQTSQLKMKFGDEAAPPQPAGNLTSAPAAEGSAVSGGVSGPQNMTPQQLADAATVVSKLPAEEQQRLMDTAAANSRSANSGVPTPSNASATTSQPAVSQLQQIAKTSQSAASAQNLENAAAQARAGFDQAIPGAPISVTSRTALSSSAQGSSQTTSATTKTPASETVSGSVRSARQVVTSANLRKPDSPEPMGVNQVATGTPGRSPGCPIVSTKKLPTREELAQQLAGLRFRLDVLKNSLLRLNRSIQMDQGQFAEWEKETQGAIERSNERLKKAIVDRIEGRFFDYSEEYYANAPEKLKALKQVEVVLRENDVYDWADKGAKTWDQVAEGMALLGENLPISQSAKDVLWASKNTIDAAFDCATELVSWRRISQLQKNSDEYLYAVKRNGEQMKQIVGRMREIEDRLASGSYVAANKPPQAGAAPCE